MSAYQVHIRPVCHEVCCMLQCLILLQWKQLWSWPNTTENREVPCVYLRYVGCKDILLCMDEFGRLVLNGFDNFGMTVASGGHSNACRCTVEIHRCNRPERLWDLENMLWSRTSCHIQVLLTIGGPNVASFGPVSYHRLRPDTRRHA